MIENDKEDAVQAALRAEPGPIEAMDVEDLFRRYHAMVFRAAYRICGNLSDAEDALQTVFLRLMRRDRNAAVGQPENYLRRAAANAALDILRTRQSAHRVALSDVEPVLAEDSSRSPESRHRAREARDWLRHAVANLAGRAADFFALRYFEGLDNQEIARMYDTSHHVVAVTLHRTREKLEKEYRERFGGRQS